ncbi:MAG TPA: KR domain-containing protein, partial [Ktedonobacteraceae bacterium]|nr:KR domain-containing protein [Ktedonobacteraceae bacterium]
DRQQMVAAMQLIEQQFGSLHGIIHAAGATSSDSIYRSMTETNRALSEEQFQAKVYGLRVLEEMLQGRELDFCLLFGSNAATLGGLGFTAYASANLFMNAFAKVRNIQGATPWLCINLDVWEQTARTKELQQYSAFHAGIEHYSMTTEEGIQAFDRVVTLLTLDEVIVSPSDFAARFDLWVKHKKRSTLSEDQQDIQPAYARPTLPFDYVEPRHEVERSMAKIWEGLLGVAPIGVYDNFFELGGHSLLATQLATHVQEIFGLKLPLQLLFETPTVADLATYVVQQLANQVDEELLSRIEQLALSEVDSGE